MLRRRRVIDLGSGSLRRTSPSGRRAAGRTGEAARRRGSPSAQSRPKPKVSMPGGYRVPVGAEGR